MTTGAETTNDLNQRMTALEIGQRETNVRLDATNTRLDSMEQDIRELRTSIDGNHRAINDRLDRMQQESNRRLDRMFYTALGVGGAMLVGLVVLYFRGG